MPPDNPDKADSSATFPTGLIDKLTAKGPVWLRAMGLVVLLLVAAAPYLGMLNDRIKAQQAAKEINHINSSINTTVGGSQTYGQGNRIPPPQDSRWLSANALKPEDAAHLSSVHTARMEQAEFQRLQVAGLDGEIDYTVYPSDGCILINHIRQNGHIKTDLVRGDSAQPANASRVNPDSIVAPRSNGDLVAVTNVRLLDADWQPPPTLPLEQLSKTPVQGSCLNPHPGQFQTWNVAVNQCLAQVFRRFADGCTHYQMYNPCNGQWDPAIHWTFCSAQHRW